MRCIIIAEINYVLGRVWVFNIMNWAINEFRMIMHACVVAVVTSRDGRGWLKV